MLDNKKFGENLSSYNLNANIQKNIAVELVQLLLSNTNNSFNKVLEIGSGSGFLTKEIFYKLNYKTLIVNDIVDKSKDYVKNYSGNFLLGDIEKISIPDNLNLVMSSSVFQWLEKLDKFILNIHNKLSNNGILAFSMFIGDNYKELRNIGNFLNYFDNNYLLKLLEKNFNIIITNEKKVVLDFDNPIDILRHIKSTGVDAISQKRINLKKLRNFISGCTSGLTYNYNFIIARKK